MKRINLMQPYIPMAARAAVADVLSTRWIGQGPKVQEFESRFSAFSNRAAVATGSGTDALHLAYLLAGIGPGDEVVAPLFTCTATNIPLLYCGAKIRFADVAPGSLNVNAETVRAAMTPNTKAVVIVHYGGIPAYVGDLGVPLIEDCAQSLGSGAPRQGEYQCYSFQAVKHVTTGDGGMLTLPAEQFAKARRLRWFGIDREAKLEGRWANDIYEVGYKYQMTDIGAAMGLAGMDELEWQIARRRIMRDLYASELDGVAGVKWLDNDADSACWLATVLADDRDGLKRKLNENRIEADQVHYRNDRYSIFADSRGSFPNMDAVDGKYLCLPMHMGLTVDDINYICQIVRSGW
jgi:perosamine synthetase